MPSYITIANTNFPQADGPLNPAQWTNVPSGSGSTPNVVGHLAETSVNNTPGETYWSGNPFPLAGNQWAEIAIHQLAGNVNNFCDLGILTAVDTFLGGFFAEAAIDGLGNVLLSVVDNTSQATIGSTFTIPFVADAILRIEFINGVVTMKYNGVTLEAISGLSSHNSDVGVPSILFGTADVVTNATVSHFAARTIVPSPAAGGGSELDFGFRFRY